MNSEVVTWFTLSGLYLLFASTIVAMPSSQTHVRHAQRDWRKEPLGDLNPTGQQGLTTFPGTSTVRIWTQKRPPPTYFTLLFNQLSSNTEFLRGQGPEDAGTLVWTLLPFKLSYGGGRALVVSFNLSSLEHLGQFQSAELILTSLRKDRKGRSRFHFQESQIDGTLTISVQSEAAEMEVKMDLETRGRNFCGFDLTDFLKEIQRKKVDIEELTMEVTRRNPEGSEVPIPMEHLFQLHSQDAPFILFHQNQLDISRQDKRKKRSSIPFAEFRPSVVPLSSSLPTITSPQFQSYPQPEPQSLSGVSGSRCHKEEWLVRPRDIGLDDILAPDFLDLGYCAGECPFPLLNDVYNFSLHSYFIDRHRILRGLQETPGKLHHSSCVAVSYKPLMIMEEGISGQLVSIHKNALVQACGCRY